MIWTPPGSVALLPRADPIGAEPPFRSVDFDIDMSKGYLFFFEVTNTGGSSSPITA